MLKDKIDTIQEITEIIHQEPRSQEIILLGKEPLTHLMSTKTTRLSGKIKVLLMLLMLD
jgi:hypothetical protein